MSNTITNSYSTNTFTTQTRTTSNDSKDYIVGEDGNLYEVVSKEDHGVLGQDDFLNMLLVQMQLQDPMNPLDTAEYMGQLTSFSMLEQLTQISSKIDDLAKAILEDKTEDNSSDGDSENDDSDSDPVE